MATIKGKIKKWFGKGNRPTRSQLAADSANAASRDCKPKGRKSSPEAENSPLKAIVLSDSTQGCSHTEDSCIPPCEHEDEDHDTLPPGRKPQENDIVPSSNRPETSSVSSSPTGLNRAHSLHARARINTPVLVETSRNVKHHDQPENPSVRASSRSRPRSYSLDAEKRPRKPRRRDPQSENSLPPRPKARFHFGNVPELSADVSVNSYANNPGQSREEKARRGPQAVDSTPKLFLASDSSSHGIGNPIPVHLPANESARSFTTTSQRVCMPKSEQNWNPDAINFTSDCIIDGNLECSGPEIGRGSYGKVRKGYFRGTECAVKTLHSELWSNPYGRSLREGFLRECQQLSRMRHPQIVQFMGVNFDSDNRPRLVMELMDCSLKQLLDSRQYISPMTRYKIFLDIIQALAYLHSGNPPVVHRDLTSKNILLTPEWRAKISDLGVAKICGSHEQGTRCPGCPLYMPPEALNPNAPCTPKIDVYSFGVVLKEVFSGSFPNPHNRDRDLQLMMTKLKEEGWSIAWYYLVLECLTSEPEHRPTAMNILKRLQDRDMSPPECHDSSAAEPGASAIAKGNCAKQRSMKDASCFSPIIVNVVPAPPPYSELDPYRLNPHPLDSHPLDPYHLDPYHLDPYHLDPYRFDPYHLDPYCLTSPVGSRIPVDPYQSRANPVTSPVGSRIPVDQSRANPVTYPQQTSPMSLSTSPETQQNTPLERSSIPPHPNVLLEPVQHNPTNLVHSSQESDCQPLQEHTPINPGRSYQDMVHGFSPMYMSSVTPTSANGESGAALQQQQVSSADIDGSELVLVSNQGNIHRRPQGMPTTGHRNTEPDEENLSSNALLGRTQTHQAASDSCTQVDQNDNPSSMGIEPEDSAANLSVQMAQEPQNHEHTQDPVKEQSQCLPMVNLVQTASVKVSEQGLPIKNAVDACVQTDTQDNPTTRGSTVETRVQTELCIDSSEGFVATKSTTDSSLQTDEQSECISNGVLESCEGSNRSRCIFTHKSMLLYYCPLRNPQTPDEQCSDLHNQSNSDTVTTQDVAKTRENSDASGPFGVDFECRVADPTYSLDLQVPQVPQEHDLNPIRPTNEQSSIIAFSEDTSVAVTDADSMSTDSTRHPLHIVKKIVDLYDSVEDSSLQKASYPDSRHDLNAISSLEPRRLSSNSTVQCTSTVFSTFPGFQDIQISLKCRLNHSVTVKACMFKFDQTYLVAVGVAAGRACVCWHISVPDCKAALFLILVAFVKVLFQLYFHYHKFPLPLQNQPTYPDTSKVVVPWKKVASPTGADSLPSVSQCKSLLLSEAFQMCFHPDSEDALPLNLPVIPSDENITVRTYHGKLIPVPVLFPHNCKPKQFLSTPWKFDYQLPTNPSKMQILPVSNSLIPWLYDLKRSREDNSFPSEFLPAKSNIPLNFPSTISSPRPITHLKTSMASLQRAAHAHSASIHTQHLKQSIAPMEYHGTLNLQSEKRLVPEHKLYICTISMLPRRLPCQHCKTNLGLVLILQKMCILPPVSCCTISSSLIVSRLMSFLQSAAYSIPYPQYLKLLASMKQKFVKHHCKKVAYILSMHESSDEPFNIIQTWMRKSIQSALSQVFYVAHHNVFNPPVEALSAVKEVLKVKATESPKPTSHSPTLNKPKFCCLVVHVQLVPTCSFLQQIPAFCTHSILYRVLPHFLDNVCCVAIAKWLLHLIEWFLALVLLLLVLIKTFTDRTTPDTQTHCYCVQHNQSFHTHSSIHGRQCLIVRQAAQSPYSTMPLTQCSQISSTMRAKTSSLNALAIIKATSTGEDRIPATKTRHKLLAYMCTWSIAMALKELLHTSRYHLITEDLIHSTLEAQCALPMSSSNVALYSFILKEYGCKVYCCLLLYTLEVPPDCHPGSSVPHAIATNNDCRRMLCVMHSHCENQLQEQLSCESTVLLLGQQSDQLFPRIDGSILHLYLEWQNASTMQRLCYWPTVSDAPKFPLSPLHYLSIGKLLLHHSVLCLEVYRVTSCLQGRDMGPPECRNSKKNALYFSYSPQTSPVSSPEHLQLANSSLQTQLNTPVENSSIPLIQCLYPHVTNYSPGSILLDKHGLPLVHSSTTFSPRDPPVCYHKLVTSHQRTTHTTRPQIIAVKQRLYSNYYCCCVTFNQHYCEKLAYTSSTYRSLEEPFFKVRIWMKTSKQSALFQMCNVSYIASAFNPEVLPAAKEALKVKPTKSPSFSVIHTQLVPACFSLPAFHSHSLLYKVIQNLLVAIIKGLIEWLASGTPPAHHSCVYQIQTFHLHSPIYGGTHQHLLIIRAAPSALSPYSTANFSQISLTTQPEISPSHASVILKGTSARDIGHPSTHCACPKAAFAQNSIFRTACESKMLAVRELTSTSHHQFKPGDLLHSWYYLHQKAPPQITISVSSAHTPQEHHSRLSHASTSPSPSIQIDPLSPLDDTISQWIFLEECKWIAYSAPGHPEDQKGSQKSSRSDQQSSSSGGGGGSSNEPPNDHNNDADAGGGEDPPDPGEGGGSSDDDEDNTSPNMTTSASPGENEQQIPTGLESVIPSPLIPNPSPREYSGVSPDQVHIKDHGTEHTEKHPQGSSHVPLAVPDFPFKSPTDLEQENDSEEKEKSNPAIMDRTTSFTPIAKEGTDLQSLSLSQTSQSTNTLSETCPEAPLKAIREDDEARVNTLTLALTPPADPGENIDEDFGNAAKVGSWDSTAQDDVRVGDPPKDDTITNSSCDSDRAPAFSIEIQEQVQAEITNPPSSIVTVEELSSANTELDQMNKDRWVGLSQDQPTTSTGSNSIAGGLNGSAPPEKRDKATSTRVTDPPIPSAITERPVELKEQVSQFLAPPQNEEDDQLKAASPKILLPSLKPNQTDQNTSDQNEEGPSTKPTVLPETCEQVHVHDATEQEVASPSVTEKEDNELQDIADASTEANDEPNRVLINKEGDTIVEPDAKEDDKTSGLSGADNSIVNNASDEMEIKEVTPDDYVSPAASNGVYHSFIPDCTMESGGNFSLSLPILHNPTLPQQQLQTAYAFSKPSKLDHEVDQNFTSEAEGILPLDSHITNGSSRPGVFLSSADTTAEETISPVEDDLPLVHQCQDDILESMIKSELVIGVATKQSLPSIMVPKHECIQFPELLQPTVRDFKPSCIENCSSESCTLNESHYPTSVPETGVPNVEQECVHLHEQLPPVVKDASHVHMGNHYTKRCTLDKLHCLRSISEIARHLQLPSFVEISQQLQKVILAGTSEGFRIESRVLLAYTLLRVQLYGNCSHPHCHGPLSPLCSVLQALRNNSQVHLETAENLCLALSRCSGMSVRVQCLSTVEQAGYCDAVPLTTYLELCAIGSEELQQWPLPLLTALIHCKVIFNHHAVPFGAVLSCIAVDVGRSCLIIDPCCFSFPQTSQDFISTLVNIAKRVLRVYASYHIKEKHSQQYDTPKYTDPAFITLLKMIIKLMEHFSMNYSLPAILSPRIVPPPCDIDSPCDLGKGYEIP